MLRPMHHMISKRSKCVALVLAGAALGFGALIWCIFGAGYYSSFPVIYGRYGYPFVKVELQGKSCELAVSIGSRFPLFLCRETLDGVDKQALGSAVWHNLNGNRCEAASFLIPKLKIGNL